MSDAVYIVGPEQHTEEFRHSLRSLAAHVDHDQVWIIGHCPDWVINVWHVDVPQDAGREYNARRNTLVAANCSGISDPFMLWHDDMYAMAPIGELPVMNSGPLSSVIGDLPRGSYRRELERIGEWLRNRGINEPRAFDALHTPQWYRRGALREAIGYGLPRHATVYGNLYRQDPGHEVANAKDPIDCHDRDWLSTSPQSWAGPVGQHIRDTFTEACQYEV